MHEAIQTYFDKIYEPFQSNIKQSLFSFSNEIYGEVYYYSAMKLLKFLKITDKDHFLDLGSGLGKLVFQLFFTTPAASVTGIEINQQRHEIAVKVKETIEHNLPDLFSHERTLNLIHGDFLKYDFDHISIIYLCSTVFSAELLDSIGKKINQMDNVKQVVSFRKLPNLDKFVLTKKIFLHGTWDKASCYLYSRKK